MKDPQNKGDTLSLGATSKLMSTTKSMLSTFKKKSGSGGTQSAVLGSAKDLGKYY